MDIIIALYISLCFIGATTIWAFNISFIRRFGWQLFVTVSRPPDAWAALYDVLVFPVNYPFIGLRRLLDPSGCREIFVESTYMAVEVVAERGELDVPMAEVVTWLAETLGADPQSEVETK